MIVIMNTLFKKIILVLLILVITIASIIAYIFATKLNAKEAQELALNKIRDKFTNINKFDQSEPELILVKNTVLDPIYTLILNDETYFLPKKNKNESRKFTIFTFYFKRESVINSTYKIANYTSVGIIDISIDELRNEVSHYDLAIKKTKLNITTIVSLTPSEILVTQNIEANLNSKTQIESYKKQCVEWFEYEPILRQAIVDGESNIIYPDGFITPVIITIEELDALIMQKKEACAKEKANLQTL